MKAFSLTTQSPLARLVNRLDDIAQPSIRFLSGNIRQHDGPNPTKHANKDAFSRLPSHTLLHLLVRRNLPNQASALAKQTMSAGVPVRCKTFEAIFCCIKENSDRNFNGGRPFSMPTDFLEKSHVLTLGSMMTDRGTKVAIDLLMAARLSKQRRSSNMYSILIAHCIDNGEIIVASLLYGILLRDWQNRKLTRELIPGPETPFPIPTHLEALCSSVTHALASDKSDVDSQFAFKASLQALANLATMLHRQTIAHHRVNSLITALYKCPRVLDKVWIYDDWGIQRHVLAYGYIQSVLYQFIHSIPTQLPAHDERVKMLPPLRRYSYMTLLVYALHHRRSFNLAEIILRNMKDERYEPLTPDTIMLNFIARAGIILRNPEITRIALSRLKGRWSSLMPRHSPSTLHLYTPLPSLLTATVQREDNYTLVIRIIHLAATGQSHAIVNILPVLFPTTFLPPKAITDEDEEEDLHRSRLFHPLVYTALLHALQKTGRTDLAEKVWKRARLAEKMSWFLEIDCQVQPWCLSAGAYLNMIKLYAKEVKKARTYRKVVHRNSLLTRMPVPISRHVLSRRMRIRGRRIPKGGFSEAGGSWTRRVMRGRYLSMRIYRSMKTTAEATSRKISKLRDEDRFIYANEKEIWIPKPNAKIFNAILDVVGHDPGASPRKVRRGPGGLYRRHRKKDEDCVGRRTRMINPSLLEVEEDMKAAGFEIPLKFQKFFVGVPKVVRSSGQFKPRVKKARGVFAIAKRKRDISEQVEKIIFPIKGWYGEGGPRSQSIPSWSLEIP